VTVVGDIHG
jgi:serine/threonine-protein phosphatase 2B catalytic subunit